ncbi:MAG: hypothetical protein R3279_07035 [Putridiphycobacter sp.]|nr:hypothetical protein [Putridiphycobacter sp.]
MPKLTVFLFILLIQSTLFCQSSWEAFSGKQKAFFYQLTRKIDNLKPAVFHLLEFTDSIPYVNDTLPDYPHVELAIENDSSKLICHFNEFARKNRGLLMDIGTHYATWELDLVLQFRNSDKPQHQYLKAYHQKFERLVLENVPSAAAKMWSDGSYTLAPKIAAYYAPNLTIAEKIAALKNSGFNTDEKRTLLSAIYTAQNEYISKRATEIVEILCGKTISSQNFLIAAGDGQNWSELESILRTKYNRPLPDPKAFFAYQLVSKRLGNSEEKTLGVAQNNIQKMATHGQMNTHLHVDVWAYHPQRQTTLIIQKGGNSYVLYGNNDNRFLSPDSTFGEGTTYANLIDELENVWIADLKEKIYGKRGFDFLIALYEKKIVKTRLNIKKTEEHLDKLRYTPEGPPKMKKKKKSRRQRKKGSSISYQDNQGVPRGQMSKTAKQKQIQQHNLVGYEGQLQTELATLKQLKKDKEAAFDLLAQYEAKLDQLKKNFGYNLMSYTTDKNGYYTFSDGTTFNYRTQDLIFKPNGEADYFEVILVSFGKTVMDNNYEEVFMHLNLNYTEAKEVYTYQAICQSPYKSQPFSESDSIQIQEFFEALLDKKKALSMVAEVTTKQSDLDTTYTSTIQNLISINKGIDVTIIGMTNQFQPRNKTPLLIKLSTKNPGISLNKIATAEAIKQYHIHWQKELMTLAEKWILNAPEQKLVLKRLAKLKLKTVIIDNNIIKV